MRYVKHLPLAAALLCASLAPSFADQIVYFVNGKAITVKSVEKGEKFTVLEMEGGGRVGVPTDQIARIEDYVVTEPVAAPVAAPVAQAAPPSQAAAAPSAAVQAVTPGTPLPLPTTQPGPGMGGRPVGGPGQNVAGLKPIEIGEPAAPPEAPQHQAPRMGAANRGAANGPTMSGPQARPYAGGRRPGRPAFAGRGAGRLAAMNPANAPPAAGSQAATGGAPGPGGASASPPPPAAPPPSESAPAAGSETEEPPPPPPDDSNEEPNDPATQPDDSSGDTSGGPS